MASLWPGTALYFNGCVPFKKAVCKCKIKIDVYFGFRFFYSSMFTNKATSFLKTGCNGNIDPSPRTLIMYVSCKNDFVGDNDCVGDNVGMGYDCSHDLLFDCE